MSKCLVVGCSFTAGTGLNLEKNDPKLWVNQLCKHIGVDGVENLSHAGVNNDWIFLETVSELVKKNYDLVLVGWSVIPRFYFNVGLELYHTGANIKNTQVVNTNTKNYNVQYFQNLFMDLLQMIKQHSCNLKTIIQIFKFRTAMIIGILRARNKKEVTCPKQFKKIYFNNNNNNNNNNKDSSSLITY